MGYDSIDRKANSQSEGVAVAIVRSLDDLDAACRLTSERRTHFVCLSLETLFRARDRGLPVTVAADYSGCATAIFRSRARH